MFTPLTAVTLLPTCIISMFQLARYSTEGLLQLGPLGSTTFLPDTKCLVDDGRGRMPSLKKCDSVSRFSQRLWDFTQVNTEHVIFTSMTHLHHLITEALGDGPSVNQYNQLFCLYMFCPRMVRSSAGTQGDVWRWKCPKTPTSACVWWCRDALVRSG